MSAIELLHPPLLLPFRQTVAFSAMAATGGLARALAPAPDPKASHILMIGDWGWTSMPTASVRLRMPWPRIRSRMRCRARRRSFCWGEFLVRRPRRRPGPHLLHAGRRSLKRCIPRLSFPARRIRSWATMTTSAFQLASARCRPSWIMRSAAGRAWTQPGLWYTFDHIPARAKDPLLHVIALDSNAPGSRVIDALDPVNFTLTAAQWQQQLEWLDAELAKPARAPFRIVLGHHPIFSTLPPRRHRRPGARLGAAPARAQHPRLSRWPGPRPAAPRVRRSSYVLCRFWRRRRGPLRDKNPGEPARAIRTSRVRVRAIWR